MAQRFWEKFNQGLETGTKIWNADAERRLKADLAAANKMTPEQQTLGLNAPQAGAVPTGYEDHLMVDTQTGKYVPTASPDVNPELHAQQGIMAERFNAPGAFVGEKTSYSLGGVSQEKPFSPEEVTAARRQAMADVYTAHGLVDKADELRVRGQQAELAGLQLKKAKSDLASDEEFKSDQKKLFDMQSSALSVATKAKGLLESGDREGAARVIAEWRSLNVPGPEQIRINENGVLEGSRDGGKTWEQASGTKGNVYNPGVVEKMLSDISTSADEHAGLLMRKHAKSVGELSQIINASKDEAFRNHQLNLTVEHWNKELAQKQDQFDRGLISAKELNQAKIDADKDIAAAHDRTTTTNARIAASRSAYPSMILQGRLKDGTIVYEDQHGGGMFTVGGRKVSDEESKGVVFTNKAAGDITKPITSTALKDIEEVAQARYPDWNKMKPAVQAELRSGIKAELGYGSAPVQTDYVGSASKDKGGGAPVQRNGSLQTRQVEAPRIDTSNWSLGMGQLARNPAAVRSAIITARNTGQQLDPQFLEVAKYLDVKQPGIFDAGVTGNANTVWLHNQ